MPSCKRKCWIAQQLHHGDRWKRDLNGLTVTAIRNVVCSKRTFMGAKGKYFFAWKYLLFPPPKKEESNGAVAVAALQLAGAET